MRPTLTSEIFGICWESELPINVTPSIVVQYKRYGEAEPIMKELFPEVFRYAENKSPFRNYDTETTRVKYYEAFGDYFIFRDLSNGKIAGMMVITLLDFVGVNLRNVSIAPDYQGNGMYQAFSEKLFDILRRHGVKTIEGDVAPSNLRHHAVLAKMGYCHTGTSLTRQWGALTHMTKFLEDGELDHFTDLYSGTSSSEKHANRHFRAETKSACSKKQ